MERGQRSLPPHREPFLHLAPHFISLLHTPIISGSTSAEGGGSVSQRERGTLRYKCEKGEIKRKSKPADVRTGCFQRCVPQHQLACCAVTGSC